MKYICKAQIKNVIKMKKVLFLLLIGGMFAVTACGGGGKTESGHDDAHGEAEKPSTEAPAPPAEEPMESVEPAGDSTVTAPAEGDGHEGHDHGDHDGHDH
jgi:hypothetical protein